MNSNICKFLQMFIYKVQFAILQYSVITFDKTYSIIDTFSYNKQETTRRNVHILHICVFK